MENIKKIVQEVNSIDYFRSSDFKQAFDKLVRLYIDVID